MKISELNGNHLGSKVTIRTIDGEVSSILHKVSHQADRINYGRLTDAEPVVAIGRRWVDLKLGAFGADNLDPMLDCKVGDN